MAELVDALGIPLADHHKWLPDRVALWPTPKKIVDKTAAQRWVWEVAREEANRCWWCGRFPPAYGGDAALEVHHMARHDAPWAFSWLCATCHRHTEAAVHSSSLPRLLLLKHKYDREHTSWIHLAIGLGRFLPTEEADDA